jgi:hypothetical protein
MPLAAPLVSRNQVQVLNMRKGFFDISEKNSEISDQFIIQCDILDEITLVYAVAQKQREVYSAREMTWGKP